MKDKVLEKYIKDVEESRQQREANALISALKQLDEEREFKSVETNNLETI